ncbi:MAG: hypothetical protein M0T70_13300 [Geobacteraceae bacterium]|nr:hypothetical protein [Geobacteraceae bacterium]
MTNSTLSFKNFSVRIVAIFCYFLFVPTVFAASLDIPAISGTVKGPAGFAFNDYHLRLQWLCLERSLDPMSLTGSKPCGGFDSKSGTQVVDISKDGSFNISPITASRYSLIRNPYFILRLGLFHNNDKNKQVKESEYSKSYIALHDFNISEHLQKDLSQLRVIRVRGSKFKIKVTTRDSNGNIENFSSLLQKYPKSYNYESRLIIYLKISDLESKSVSADVINSQVVVPEIEFLQVGAENSIAMDALIKAGIGLVKKTRDDYKFYQDEVWLRNLSVVVNESLEASFDPNVFKAVNMNIDIK